MRTGYNKVAREYAITRTSNSEDVQLLRELVERLPKNAIVLDAGCGCGRPVTRFLTEHCQVVGIDFALEQIRLAKREAIGVEFVCADIANLPIRGGAFQAVCCYYTIIHVHRTEHQRVLEGFLNILKPGGLALLCMGAGDLPEDKSCYHGAPMFWSHYDGDTNIEMITQAGFHIIWSKFIVDPTHPSRVHLFVLAEGE